MQNLSYKHRHIEKKLQRITEFFKVILVTGARQVGKSTVLKHSFPTLERVTFDPNEDIFGARENPSLFLQTHATPLILNEIQYVPQLLSTIKRVVDESSIRPQFLMTGSHNLAMLSSVAESMAGRVGILHLSPCTFYELAGDTTSRPWISHYLEDPASLSSKITGRYHEQNLVTTLWRGGMPGFIDTPSELLHVQFSSYINTYLERDIRTLAHINNLSDFRNFMGIIAALTAQEINHSQLGREIDVAGKTATAWTSHLSNGYQWRTIPAYHGNALKRVTKKQKGYITDTGLACHLQHISSPQALLSHPLRGALFETFIVNTICAVLDAESYSVSLYHWRSDGGAEVDLIISVNGALFPIEIKMTSTLSKHDIRGLRAFRETYHSDKTPVMKGIVVYTGTECYHLDEHTLAVPWNVRCS